MPLQAGSETAKGQFLPLLRQGEGADSALDVSPTELLDDLSLRLEDLTETIDQLLAKEANADGEGPLSQFLKQELGLDQQSVDQVMQALKNWIENPPEVAMTPEQLESMDPEVLNQIEGLSRLLGDLDQELSRWLAEIDPEQAPTVAPDGGPSPLASLADMFPAEMRRLGEGKPEGDSKEPPSPARFIARTLQTVLNSATNGSLPSSPDMSRPELALLTTGASQPSNDVSFNNTLLDMARATFARKAGAESESPMQLASLSDAADTAVLEAKGLAQKPDLTGVDRGLMRAVERPVMANEMGRQLGERVLMMARGEIKQASIRLDPPELGMMDIKISVQNDQTQVQIVVQNPQVREALESQSAKLREFLEQQGLSLDNLDVREESRGQSDGDESGDGDGRDSSGEPGSGLADEGGEPLRQWRQGLVDDFV
ncbi:hypothetical protein GCM10007392_17400 [Saccharospirillum salsuginis]|uniref:Flagellar hook-length control protein-like C-terminal domain-containing protein n=1 Tax=Saccharospirillum salsuginis TaxID=418750 RepID=A0A918K7A4_9GAMM|nr:hypothetical protein GCM10007392_17400 [Saccharospirillum salsuginis]